MRIFMATLVKWANKKLKTSQTESIFKQSTEKLDIFVRLVLNLNKTLGAFFISFSGFYFKILEDIIVTIPSFFSEAVEQALKNKKRV